LQSKTEKQAGAPKKGGKKVKFDGEDEDARQADRGAVRHGTSAKGKKKTYTSPPGTEMAFLNPTCIR
jgi:hypothetical protein